MRLYAFALFALVACSKSEATPTPQPVEASAPVAAPPVDAGPQRTTKKGAFARFVGEALSECIDIQITDVTRHDEAGAAVDQIGAAGKTLPGATRISQSCAEAFGDRQVLASCTMTDRNEKGSSELVFSYYDFAKVGLSDTEMKQCLEVKGAWSAVPRTSREWRRAKLDHDVRELRKATGKLEEP